MNIVLFILSAYFGAIVTGITLGLFCRRIGTRSVLLGAHAFWYHPFAVAMGWWKLYGFPWHPALWLCFFFHDIGYIGMPNMDGPEGESHPWLGSFVVFFLTFGSEKWGNECLYHSRHLAKSMGAQPSRLCMADKLAPVYTPAWLYIPGTRLSGELAEYMANGKKAEHAKVGALNHRLLTSNDPYEWYAGLRGWMKAYAEKHKDGQTDNVTEVRHA